MPMISSHLDFGTLTIGSNLEVRTSWRFGMEEAPLRNFDNKTAAIHKAALQFGTVKNNQAY